jgi:hypothetical protein
MDEELANKRDSDEGGNNTANNEQLFDFDKQAYDFLRNLPRESLVSDKFGSIRADVLSCC